MLLLGDYSDILILNTIVQFLLVIMIIISLQKMGKRICCPAVLHYISIHDADCNSTLYAALYGILRDVVWNFNAD